MGFEPTRGDPIGLAGRRLNHSAKVSLRMFRSSTPVKLQSTQVRKGDISNNMQHGHRSIYVNAAAGILWRVLFVSGRCPHRQMRASDFNVDQSRGGVRAKSRFSKIIGRKQGNHRGTSQQWSGNTDGYTQASPTTGFRHRNYK